MDGWQSGLMRTPGKRVCRKATRVRIPAHPPAPFLALPFGLRGAMRSLVAALFLSSLLTLTAAEPGTVGVDPVERARREFENGKLDATSNILDEAEKQGVRNGFLLDLRGCVLMEQGKLDEAIKAFEASHKEDANWLGHLHLGDALRRQQKWDEARDAYRGALKETNILVINERLRFGVFITYLGAKDEEHARQTLERIPFPTESAAYYFAQAAWAFAHGSNKDAQNWVKRAEEIFPAKSTAWFSRHLFEFGWLKTKPPLTFD